MTDKSRGRVLSEAERQAVRRQLRAQDGGRLSNFLLRIGRPAADEYSDIDWRKHRFGQSMILVGIFILVLFLVLPNDDRRWIFIGFALLTAALGARQIDKARRKSGKK